MIVLLTGNVSVAFEMFRPYRWWAANVVNEALLLEWPPLMSVLACDSNQLRSLSSGKERWCYCNDLPQWCDVIGSVAAADCFFSGKSIKLLVRL